MGGDGAAVHKGQQLGHGLGDGGLAAQHLVGDVGDLGDLGGQQHAGVDQFPVAVHHLAVGQLHRADLDDPVLGGVQAGGFKVQHHDVQRQIILRAGHGLVVVGEIALHAGEQFDVVLLRRAKGFGEGLHHAVVGNGDGLVAPLRRPRD